MSLPEKDLDPDTPAFPMLCSMREWLISLGLEGLGLTAVLAATDPFAAADPGVLRYLVAGALLFFAVDMVSILLGCSRFCTIRAR